MRYFAFPLSMCLIAFAGCAQDADDDDAPLPDYAVRAQRDAGFQARDADTARRDAAPRRDGGVPGQDAAAVPRLDAGGRDAAPPGLDAEAPGADAAPPRPDAAGPRLDAAPPRPDMAPPEPGDEVCNGRDDDGDGQSDEGFGVGEVCVAGQGLCREEGVLFCAVDGTARCSAQAPLVGPERCNGQDDDCDGQIDEGLENQGACSAGEGACAAMGRQACVDGEPTCDATPGAPGVETCDGTDEDCDGRVDEGVAGCATIAGSWRWDVTDREGGRFPTLAALSEDDGEVVGLAIDTYGLADVEGTVDGATRRFDLVKTYRVGASEGAAFRYTGTVDGDALSGTWMQVGGDDPPIPLRGDRGTAIAPLAVAGAWVFRPDFDENPGAMQLVISPEGWVTGTMRDRVGDSTVEGVLDRGAGALWFRKVYDAGGDFWYRADASGASIEQGTYSNDSDSGVRGVWRAER